MAEEGNAYEYDEVEIEEKEGTGEEEEESSGSSEQFDEGEGDADEGEEDLSPAEELARSEGWVPESDWKGDSDDWVDYREFNYRGELMKRIKSQSSQIHPLKDEVAELKTAMKALGEHNKKIAETEYNRALRDLKAQRRSALEEDDYDVADELEEKIDELKDAKKELDVEEPETEEKKDTTKKELPPAQKQIVSDWYEDPKNKWYQEDVMLQPIADKLFVGRLEQNGGDFSEAFTFMGNKMKERFPDEVGAITKKGRAVSESSGRATGRSKGNKTKYTKSNLSEEQARVGKTFVDTGVYDDIQEYVDQLAASGQLS